MKKHKKSHLLFLSGLFFVVTACAQVSPFAGKKDNPTPPAGAKANDKSGGQVDVNGADPSKNPGASPVPGTNPKPVVTTTSPAITPDAGVITNNEQCYKADDFICKAEVACLQQTNALRGKLPPLKQSAKFAFVARQWSKTQSQRGDIGHQGFPRARQSAYASEFGSQARIGVFAENVAMSGSDSNDPVAVAKMLTDMWWHSHGHRVNMLSNNKVLGCGIAKIGTTYYGTQIFGEE